MSVSPSLSGSDVAITSSRPDAREAAAPALLEVSGLTVGFPGLLAVQDIGFAIRRGEILALVGESGSGKSVTALSILKLLPYPGRLTAGSVRLDGRELLTLSERELATIRGRRIAMVQQQPRAALNPAFRVGAQLLATLRRHQPALGAAARLARATALLGEVGFPETRSVLASFPHQLSGGMCQRVCLALALAGEPELLIADEPTTMLDVAVQAQILLLLRRLNRQRDLAILLVTHDLALVRALAHSVVVLRHGRIQEKGRADRVLDAPQHPYTQALIAAMPDTAHAAGRESPPLPVPLLEVQGLTKRFREGGWFSRDPGHLAVDRVSFTIDEGTTLACVGESGSGKSTLGRLVLRLIEADGGTVSLAGRDVLALQRGELRALRRQMQLVFQDPMLALNPKRTIAQNLARPLANYGVRGGTARKRVEELLDLVTLGPAFANRYPNELSGGQCQRVAIARALALEPRFLVLDEPVSALDVSVQAQILDLLLELQARLRLTYLFITHDLRLLPYMAQQVVVMYRGRIIERGRPGPLWQSPQHPYTRRLKAGVLGLAAPPDWALLERELEGGEPGPEPSFVALESEGVTIR
jgi:ABC-type glutathione transport system ATPase component